MHVCVCVCVCVCIYTHIHTHTHTHSRIQAVYMCGDTGDVSVGWARPMPTRRMLTYADVCGRMLTYANVWWSRVGSSDAVASYADVC